MRKSLLFTFLSLILFFCAKGQDIYTYTSATTGVPSYTDPNLASYTSLTAIGTGTTMPCASGFSGIDGFTPASYSVAGPCIQITLTAATGYTINATGFAAGLRSSAAGPVKARLAYSSDGVTWIDEGIDHVPLSSGACAISTAGTNNASWTTFCVTNTTLYFRIYPYGASSVGGSIQIYGLHIIGSVVNSSTITTPTITAGGPTTFCSGGSVTLHATTGAGFGYQWLLGGLPISGATNANYSATAGGAYTVNVTGPVFCLYTPSSISVTVNPLPTPVVTAGSATTFCASDSVVLTSSTGAGYSYQWYLGSLPIGGATTITHTANTTGNFKMQVTDALGCVGYSTPVAITVNPLPNANITSVGSPSICTGSSVVLNTTSNVGYTYQWYNTGTPIGGATASSYTANAAGSYTVKIIITATGCTETSSTPIVVVLNPVPTSNITVSGGLTFCDGGNVTLTAPSGAGYFYQWQNAGVNIAGATNVTYTAIASGTYKVTVTNSFGCPSTTATATAVVVNPNPAAVITPVGSATFCLGGNVVLNSTTGAGDTYRWYNGGTPIAGATNSSYTASASGSYTVKVTNVFGCNTTSAIQTVNAVPTPYIVAASATTFCEGNNVLLTANTSGATVGVTYQWKKNTVNVPGATAATYVATTAGVYTCFVNIAGSCAMTTVGIIITVTPSVIPVISFNGATLSTYNFYPSYQWYLNTVALVGDTTDIATAVGVGNYMVRVVDTNGCILLSSQYTVNYLAVKNINGYNEIKIFPNPAYDVVHISAPMELTAVISGLDGKVIIDHTTAKDINTAQLSPGIYMIMLYDESGNRVHVEKLLIQ